ncbi:MAG: 4-(cytidine 5'-diphospho)-2-C-methyl-D-erythritol kinase [Desulfovibrionaceae bacterium]|nr:4-(cytidine 5'-diphospho)-2-C-methyl-D-erythritol kinase [Desulfovibrionaceae bacterium]
MDTYVLRSGCKINLTLHITSVRGDGMHELDSLFWPLDEPHDELTLTVLAPGAGLRVLCGNGIDPEHNTLTKACRNFADACGFAPDLELTLNKGVPSGAGLGGGSADAAALLLWLNSHAPAPLPAAKLAECAAKIGADVPFFLINKPCRAQGIGERLTPVPELAERMKGWNVLLACPDVHVSTPWAYGAWDQLHKNGKTPQPSGLTNAEAEDKGNALAASAQGTLDAGIQLFNAFESVVFSEYPQVASLKAAIMDLGADAAVMSGSGAAVCGLFSPKNAARGEDLLRFFEERNIKAWWQALSA